MKILNIQWEYKTMALMPDTVIADSLNEAGADGWECFALHFTGVGTQCFLKRPKVVGSPLTTVRQVNDKE